MRARHRDDVAVGVGERERAVPRRAARLRGPALDAGVDEALAVRVDVVGGKVEHRRAALARFEEEIDVPDLEDRDDARVFDGQPESNDIAVERRELREVGSPYADVS